jgi:hypothetical protein
MDQFADIPPARRGFPATHSTALAIMFYVQATLQQPKESLTMSKGHPSNFPREAYVCWDTMPSLADVPCFRSIDDPAIRPVSGEEAERLMLRCQEVHGSMYDHNLRIVSA